MGLSNQEHVMKLCLPPELHLALIKFQAKQELGRPYAGLLLLTKQLYNEHLLGQEAYEVFTMRYSRKLVAEENQTHRVLSTSEIQEKQKIEEKQRLFSSVLDQWSLQHRPGWKEGWIRNAKQWQDRVKAAKLICDLEVR